MIEDNPLAEGQAALNSQVWSSRLIGKELTPFSAELLSDPALEAGDIITVSDLHGNTYQTPVTNLIYRLDGSWINVGTLSGVSIIGESGRMGGWTIQGNKLVSADGTMVLDGNNNTVTVNDGSGQKFMQIKNGGVTYFRPDENDVMHEIGSIGVAKAANADTYGLTFNLKDGDAMTWSIYDQATGNYNNKLRYEASDGRFIFNGDMEINGSIKNQGVQAVSGNFWAIKSITTTQDASVTLDPEQRAAAP